MQGDAVKAPRQREMPDAWQATRAQTSLVTQFVNEEDYLAATKPEVGRMTGANVHEFFVSCDPAQALQQQFEHLQPDFIAVHDIATASSRKLLNGIAAASGRAVQKLVIRRQGYGTALASIEFIELPKADGTALRMYSTEADGDTAARDGLDRMLLGFSRLGVIMIGELPPHATESALQPIREAMLRGPWPNRQLLLLPLASASPLVGYGVDLSTGTGVNVRTTPKVTRPADAWGFITASWSRLGEQPTGAGASSAAQRPANPVSVRVAGLPQTDPLAMRPMPPVPTAASRRAAAVLPPADLLERYLLQLGQLTGLVSCCIFEVANGREVAHAGTAPNGTELALQGSQLLSAMTAASRTLGLGQALPDAAISLAEHHLLLRGVPRHPGLALHAVLDKIAANLTLVRLQLQRMDALFDEPVRA